MINIYLTIFISLHSQIYWVQCYYAFHREGHSGRICQRLDTHKYEHYLDCVNSEEGPYRIDLLSLHDLALTDIRLYLYDAHKIGLSMVVTNC